MSPASQRRGKPCFLPHAYFLRFNTQGKISRLDAYWDNPPSSQHQAERRIDNVADDFEVRRFQ